MFTENKNHGKHVYHSSSETMSKLTCALYLKIDQVKRQMFIENHIASSHYMFTINQMG